MSKAAEYCYLYPHPALTVDAVIFTFSGDKLKVLLIRRVSEPFKDRWAFPGGFTEEHETVEQAVKRELEEEVSLEVGNLSQLFTASSPGRDPRGWTVSTVFTGSVNQASASVRAGDDAKEAHWIALDQKPSLAFDHEHLFLAGKNHLKNLARFSIVYPNLLEKEFSMEAIHLLYYQITGSKEETVKLMKRLLDSRVLGLQRTSGLYSFNYEMYLKVMNLGFTAL